MRFHNSDLGYQLEKKGHTQQQEQQETMQATPRFDHLGICRRPEPQADLLSIYDLVYCALICKYPKISIFSYTQNHFTRADPNL